MASAGQKSRRASQTGDVNSKVYAKYGPVIEPLCQDLVEHINTGHISNFTPAGWDAAATCKTQLTAALDGAERRLRADGQR